MHAEEIADFLLGWFGLDIMGDDAHALPPSKEARHLRHRQRWLVPRAEAL